MFFKNTYQTILIFTLAVFWASHSYANVLIEGLGPTATISGRVNVTNDTPIGSVISEKFPVVQYQATLLRDATAGTVAGFTFSTNAAAIYSNDVYPTNVPGIGVRYFVNTTSNPALGSQQSGEYTIKSQQFKWSFSPSTVGQSINFNIIAAVQFIKTGAVTQTNNITYITPLSVATFNHTGYSWPKPDVVGSVSNLNITTVTCSQPFSSSISLPTVSISNFSSIGKTGGETPFSVNSNCSGNVKFKFQFSPTSNFFDISKSILNNNLTGSDAATGIGIQIIDGNGGVIDANTIKYEKNIDSNAFYKQFKARYYSTQSAVNPGKIESVLIYSFDYY